AMWLVERRLAAKRERMLDESHARLERERRELDVLLGALRDSTRAVTMLEAGHRRLSGAIEMLAGKLDQPTIRHPAEKARRRVEEPAREPS
ncbi:MAG: hypothetical protein AAFU70_13920, partial [Planctomycetota bacterium]